jgi:Flp pilus assembly protein TadG
MTHINQTITHRLRRLQSDERGVTFIYLGLGFMAFVAASMLAIDVGQITAARTQAQRAADAGALSAATALVFDDFDDRSENGPAVTSGMNTAKANHVIGSEPSVVPADVTFEMNPDTGRSDIVQVVVHRTIDRGNPLGNLIGPIFGHDTTDVRATARAVVLPAGAATCVLPLTIPDRWTENQTGPWTPDDTFDLYGSQGNQQNVGAPLGSPDEYVAPGQVGATGYNAERDKGTRLVLKNNNQNKVAPSIYNAWDIPGSVGGDDFRENLGGCNPNLIKIGDNMPPANGNMVGPTKDGGDDLYLQDPKAEWNEGCKCVKGGKGGMSPRIRIVPLYHPVKYTEGQHSGKANPVLEVVNYIGFFIEGVNGAGEITGVIVPTTGRAAPGAPLPIGAFAQEIRLIK